MQFSRCVKDDIVFYRAENLNCETAVHGFSTRLGGVSSAPFDSLNLGLDRGDLRQRVEENCCRFCTAIGASPRLDRIVCAKQVHSDAVRTVTMADAGKGFLLDRDYEADGLITDIPGLKLMIFSADCIPVLLHDPVRRVIGACHAGWRGTALGIAAKTAEKMQSVYGCNPADLRCAIGPGISLCCFETNRDVPQAMKQALGTDADRFITENDSGKFHVDLKAINRYWLQSAGVPADQIAVSSACTACDTKTFFSHRRTGDARGSLAAVIELI